VPLELAVSWGETVVEVLHQDVGASLVEIPLYGGLTVYAEQAGGRIELVLPAEATTTLVLATGARRPLPARKRLVLEKNVSIEAVVGPLSLKLRWLDPRQVPPPVPTHEELDWRFGITLLVAAVLTLAGMAAIEQGVRGLAAEHASVMVSEVRWAPWRF